MAQRKAEFREGQANYNRLIQLHRNLNRSFKEINSLDKRHNLMMGNLFRAGMGAEADYRTPAETNRIRLIWRARERKLRQKYEENQQEINLKIARMRPIIREYYILRFGLPHVNETNINLWHNIRYNIQSRVFSPKRQARLKLARLINQFATRPGRWVYKRLFPEGNQPQRVSPTRN
jgi:hypothetical protein